MSRTVGYLVLCDGHPYKQPTATAALRKCEIGRLFYPSYHATVWRTHRDAERAMRRSVTAWGRDPIEAQRWRVLALKVGR